MKWTMVWTFLFILGMSPEFQIILAQTNNNEKESADSTKTEEKEEDKSKKKKPKEPKFEDLVDGYVKIEGLFTIYSDSKEGKAYLEIRQDQFGPLYLCNVTRQSGDASIFDSGAMMDEFLFYIERVGKNIQFIRKNVAFRVNNDAAIKRALEKDIPNSIWANAKIASQPHPELGSILIDATEIFINDYANVAHITSTVKIPYTFDKENSHLSLLKSFPYNTEIEATLHFKSSKPQPLFNLADSRSMFHRYYYSLSTLPESDYKSREADDRLGHFLTMFQDYSSQLEDTPYRYYITRWNLEKSEPKFSLSKPKKPITFWIENTVPVEYRDAVREGILLWNKAFEKIGFENAMEVRQMPDDADWDPADVRYNTVRWIIQPGGGYAVGPSRANPLTGEIYDADIRVSSDYVRFFYREFGEFVTPLSWMDVRTDQLWPVTKLGSNPLIESQMPVCNYADGKMHQMAFGWNLLISRGLVGNNPEDLKQFVHDGIVDLIVHEVGHTLGLRHNFKASANIDIENLSNKNYTRDVGISASVMDYNPVNLAPAGRTQGKYFQTTLGPYDYWAIEYAYKPLEPGSKTSEKEMLDKIAQKVTEPLLQYGTDYDAFGLSTRGADPSCNLYDLGNDPLLYYQQRITMAQELWKNIPDKFEKEGEQYQKFRRVFGQGLTEYAIAAANLPKYIGGIYAYRDHIGDPKGRSPFRVVSAEKQRQTLKTITDLYFSPNAFQFSAELLNKLAPDYLGDFEGSPWRRLRSDYPIHGIVQLLQASALFRLYDPLTLQRLQDNELRFEKSETPFTMAEMFKTVRSAIWREVSTHTEISSFRRELQRIHLYVLTQILVNEPSILPHDAITLARFDLVNIQSQIENHLSQSSVGVYTTAHLQEIQAKINAILNAQIQKSF
ncbi:MAG: zinc-dependent metalloprotease [bacterium]|nr:MAG: zinc-dependent metalloprotease [bacterium]